MTATIAQFLHASERIDTADQATFNGFNGLHGGLAVAMLVREMRVVVAPDKELVGLHGALHPATGLADRVGRRGRQGMARRSRSLVQPRRLTRPRASRPPRPTATACCATAPCSHPRCRPESRRCRKPLPFTPPAEFIPISRRMTIRAATSELPYSGSTRPVLCGWVRLTDEVPSNEERISILIDSSRPFLYGGAQ